MKKLLLTMAVIFIMIAPANAVLIGGIDFPDGPVSFADAVYSYSPGPDVGPGWNNPDAALGIPDWTGNYYSGSAVSLGNYGSLVLRFTDNSLTTSGDNTADLHIFEIGGAVEWMNVAISTDSVSWIDLGSVKGQPTSLDIDAIAGVTSGTQFSFVRITDISPEQSGYPYGEADIDAVGAISSAPPVTPVPEPTTLLLLGSGLLAAFGFRKKFRK